jgi:hypothetical protein
MQLKADGEINSVEEGRNISLASSEVLRYSPENTEEWNAAYERFIEIIDKNRIGLDFSKR